MAYSPRLIDRFLERWRLASPNPAPHPAPRPALPPKAEPAAGMKAQKIFGAQSPIKTYGVEHDARIYGALGFSREQIQRSVQKGRNATEAHAKEIAPIKSYEYAGSPPNGIGLLDQALLKRTEAWEAEQAMKVRIKAGPSVSEILPKAFGSAPIKTMQN